MDAGEILSVDLQECGGDIASHERVIRHWLCRYGAGLSREELSEAMVSAFGMSFEADEALNISHAALFGKIIQE